MGAFSIKDIEQITGIKAHTIRIWEKRYGVLSPTRSKSNIRQYSDEDLRRILNISALSKRGDKISFLSKLPNHELDKLSCSLLQHKHNEESTVNALILAILSYDEATFKQIVDKVADTLQFEELFSTILLPLLIRIGLEWQTGQLSPAQEHFASNLVRELLFSEIRKIEPPQSNRPPILFFLPEHEYHDIPLLAYHYITRKKGIPTLFLGQSIPLEYLKTVTQHLSVGGLFTVFSSITCPITTNAAIRELSNCFSKTPIFIGGRSLQADSIQLPVNIKIVDNYRNYINILDEF